MSALDETRLDPFGTAPHPRLGDEEEQRVHGDGVVGVAAAAKPGEPQLYGVIEAQLAGDLIRMQRGLGNQESDQIMGEQAGPQLFLGHRRAAVRARNWPIPSVSLRLCKSSLTCQRRRRRPRRFRNRLGDEVTWW